MQETSEASTVRQVLSGVIAFVLIGGTLGLGYYLQTQVFKQPFIIAGPIQFTPTPSPIPSPLSLTGLSPLPTTRPSSEPEFPSAPDNLPFKKLVRPPAIIDGEYAYLGFPEFEFQIGFPTRLALYEDSSSSTKSKSLDFYRLDSSGKLQAVAYLSALKDGLTSELGGVDESNIWQKAGANRWKVVVYTHEAEPKYSLFLKSDNNILYWFTFPGVTNYNQLSPDQKFMVESFEIVN